MFLENLFLNRDIERGGRLVADQQFRLQRQRAGKLRNGCVDIAQPDICAAGGLTETRRIAALCETFGANVTPHCWGTGIAFAAALHFTSTLDMLPGRLRAAEPLLEMDRSENPLRDRLTLPRFIVDNGTVAVPDVPGLGARTRDRAGRLAGDAL